MSNTDEQAREGLFYTSVRLFNYGVFERYLSSVARVSRGVDPLIRAPHTDESWKRVVRNCFNAGHMTIFEFGDLTFYIECPIFVARQLMRYRHASYIERSLRYCAPSEEGANERVESVRKVERDARAVYDDLVEKGYKKEVARAVLPLSSQTAFLMKVDLRELFHIFDERLRPDAQSETREVVEKMKEIASRHYPYCVELWEEKRRRLDESDDDQ